MSALPGTNTAYDEEFPQFDPSYIHGAPWEPKWRDRYPISPDEIRNHTTPAALGVFDGADNASEWNQYQGTIQSDPISLGTQHSIDMLGPIALLQVMRIPQPDAIGVENMQNTNGQAQMSGVDSLAALVPFLELPDYGQGQDYASMAGFGGMGGLPFHFDYGNQIDTGQAIGPRQIFRSPPAYSDQTAAMIAAGF